MEEGQREGDTESETGSRLWAVSTEPDAGLELTDREIITWAEVGRPTDWATQAPHLHDFYIPVRFENTYVPMCTYLHAILYYCHNRKTNMTSNIENDWKD